MPVLREHVACDLDWRAMEDDDSDWWTSQAAIDFAESIKKTNWHG